MRKWYLCRVISKKVVPDTNKGIKKMKKTYKLTVVLAICFALMSSCIFPHHKSDPNSTNTKPEKSQIKARNKAAMDQITAEMFEPKMEEAVKKIGKQDFMVNKKEEKFILECERYGSVSLESKKDNTGKYGTCQFRVLFYKQKRRTKIYKGSADLVLKGLIEIRSDGSLQFVPTEYMYEKIDVSIWQWKKSDIKEGVVYVLNWAPTMIDAIKH